MHQIVFTDGSQAAARKETDGDILRSMLTELCRHKAKLMLAFLDAENQLANEPGGKTTKRHELPYHNWLSVLCKVFPVYASLWREYAPKLTDQGAPVLYRRWLDRFQVGCSSRLPSRS